MNTQLTEATDPLCLSDYVPEGEWLACEGGTIFNTDNRWTWFKRKNRDRLVKAGMIRRWHNRDYVHQDIGQEILAIGAR